MVISGTERLGEKRVFAIKFHVAFLSAMSVENTLRSVKYSVNEARNERRDYVFT